MNNFVRVVMAAACAAGLLAGTATDASAQDQTSSSPSPKPTQAIVTDVTEPDFALVNLPTTRPLKKFRSSFHLTHRFLGNLRQGTFKDNLGNVFGLDNGAIIGLEYRFAFTDTLQAVFYRNSADKTIQFSARYDAIRQGDKIPASLSVIGSIEGNQNFGLLTSGEDHSHVTGAHEHKEPAIAAVVSRTVGMHAAFYAVPVFVHNSLKLDDTSHRNTFYVGMGGRLRVRPTVFLVGEATPRFAGYAPGSPEFGFGIEKRAGGHMFQLTFSNATATTFGQVARGGFPTTIYLGFNLGRKF
jgi:hypothetical protein